MTDGVFDYAALLPEMKMEVRARLVGSARAFLAMTCHNELVGVDPPATCLALEGDEHQVLRRKFLGPMPHAVLHAALRGGHAELVEWILREQRCGRTCSACVQWAVRSTNNTALVHRIVTKHMQERPPGGNGQDTSACNIAVVEALRIGSVRVLELLHASFFWDPEYYLYWDCNQYHYVWEMTDTPNHDIVAHLDAVDWLLEHSSQSQRWTVSYALILAMICRQWTVERITAYFRESRHGNAMERWHEYQYIFLRMALAVDNKDVYQHVAAQTQVVVRPLADLKRELKGIAKDPSVIDVLFPHLK